MFQHHSEGIARRNSRQNFLLPHTGWDVSKIVFATQASILENVQELNTTRAAHVTKAHFEKVDIPKLNSVPLVTSTAATCLSKQLIKQSNPPSNKLPVLSQMFLSNPMGLNFLQCAVWM